MSVASGPEAADSQGLRGPIAVLVGPPGSGKTTVGRALASSLDVGFRDTDHDIETSTGSSIPDLFVSQGEATFRALEVAAVERALAEHRGVLALGAGAVLDASTRERLRGHTVVHLRVGLAAAMERLEMNRSRPLLLGNVRGRWQVLAAEREPMYEEVATVSVVTDGRSAAEVAAAVEVELVRTAGVKASTHD